MNKSENMNCKNTHKNILSYIEENLSSKQKAEFENHIQGCDECMQLYSQLKNTYGIIKKEKSKTTDDFYFTRLQNKIEQNKKPKEFSISQLFSTNTISLAIAAMLIVITAFTGIFIGLNLNNSENYFSEESTREDKIEAVKNEYYMTAINEESIEYFILTSNQNQ
ncbi:MAG: zf-HC2 domain-containing protein [Bacteroidota bacterium]|nr:zf-HC2 domain-containing protein [Bacteroidota bacterium]